MTSTSKKPRGAPRGPRGPNKGSRPYQLLNLKPGKRIIFVVEDGPGASRLMQQIGMDITRCGLSGKIKQSHIVGVEMGTRTAIEMVSVLRLDPDTEGSKT